MSGEKFRLVMSGNLVNGFERADVEEELARLMQLPLEHARILLQGKPSKLPQELGLEKVVDLHEKLNACGVENRIEPIIEEIADKHAADTVTSTSPPADDVRNADDMNLTEENTRQPVVDDLEVVDSLDLDLDIPMPQGTESIVLENNLGEIVALPEQTDKEENNEDSGQFFEQPSIAMTHDDVASKRLSPLSNRRLLLPLGGLSLVVLLVITYIFIGNSSNETIVTQKQPGSQIGKDQRPADPELNLTRKQVDGLSRQVRVWMIEYGSGDPMLVTLKRLQQDLAISVENMIDGWGMPLRYEPAKRSFVIRSAGPDKAFKTEDDLVKKVVTE